MHQYVKIMKALAEGHTVVAGKNKYRKKDGVTEIEAGAPFRKATDPELSAFHKSILSATVIENPAAKKAEPAPKPEAKK